MIVVFPGPTPLIFCKAKYYDALAPYFLENMIYIIGHNLDVSKIQELRAHLLLCMLQGYFQYFPRE